MKIHREALFCRTISHFKQTLAFWTFFRDSKKLNCQHCIDDRQTEAEATGIAVKVSAYVVCEHEKHKIHRIELRISE